MFIFIKRKNIAVICGVIAICICAYLGFTAKQQTHNYSKDNTVVSTDAPLSDEPETGEAVMVSASHNYISDAKMQRETVRSKACEILIENINNPNASEELRKESEYKLIKMSEEMDMEMECEALLSAKGYSECIVFISDKSVSVTVQKDNLSAEDTAKINDIIFQISGNNNIKIVEVR